MYKNILLPLNGSKLAEESIPTALDLAKVFGARITLLQIYEVLPLLKKDREIESRVLRHNAEQYMNPIMKKIQENGISADVVVREGPHSREICNYAERSDVDLIVLTSQGLGALESLAIGSVSQKVLKDSPKPILLLRVFSGDPLKDKTILAVDDEPDILEILEETLDMCVLHTATTFKSACEHLEKYKYDAAIIDIMGVNGFDLLKRTKSRAIPTLMLTAKALTADALRKSMKGGAVFFLPKENMLDIEELLREVIRSGGRPIWQKVFGRFAQYFEKRFEWNYEDEQDFLNEVNEISGLTKKSKK